MNKPDSIALRGRPREFCLDDGLAKALRVFWSKGYEGTSLTDLTEAIGITRPSLYAAFGNKESLFRKALDLYEREKLEYVGRALAQPTARCVAEVLLTLREAGYPPVQYFPREDVDMGLLEPSEHQTYCPYKGDCSYFSIANGDERLVNAVWSYEAPFPAASSIQGHVAFYSDRLDYFEEQSGE